MEGNTTDGQLRACRDLSTWLTWCQSFNSLHTEPRRVSTANVGPRGACVATAGSVSICCGHVQFKAVSSEAFCYISVVCEMSPVVTIELGTSPLKEIRQNMGVCNGKRDHFFYYSWLKTPGLRLLTKALKSSFNSRKSVAVLFRCRIQPRRQEGGVHHRP